MGAITFDHFEAGAEPRRTTWRAGFPTKMAACGVQSRNTIPKIKRLAREA
jgi:hypothetical protein